MTAAARTSRRPWSLNRQAAKAVAINAKGVDDARLLLDMLGLVDGPEGREILPDDKRALDIEMLRACPGEPVKDDVLAERPAKTNTVPAGLTAATEPTPPPSLVAALAALPPLLEPDMTVIDQTIATPPARRGGRPSIPIQHGSEYGYQQHKRKRVPIPDDDACGCQAAHNATLKRSPAASVVWSSGLVAEARASVALDGETHVVGIPLEYDVPPPTSAAVPKRPASALPPIEHGTVDGYHAHLDRGALPVCEDCRAAIAELTAAAEPVAPPLAVAPVDLDVWFTAAEQSPSQSVRRAARSASTALLQLLAAMDALTRAERLQARQAAGDGRG
jgi:hypothetical protein